jgi:hypothetical protein
MRILGSQAAEKVLLVSALDTGWLSLGQLLQA